MIGTVETVDAEHRGCCDVRRTGLCKRMGGGVTVAKVWEFKFCRNGAGEKRSRRAG